MARGRWWQAESWYYQSWVITNGVQLSSFAGIGSQVPACPARKRLGFWENDGMGTTRRRHGSRKGLTSPCKSCRRRIRPELLDKTFLCDTCRNDPAAKWLAARTPQPAPADAPAKHKQGPPRRKKKVNPGTIRWVEPSKPIASARQT